MSDYTINENKLSHEGIVNGDFVIEVEGKLLTAVIPVEGHEYDDNLSDKGNASTALETFLATDKGIEIAALLDSEDEFPVLTADTTDEVRDSMNTLSYLAAEGTPLVGYVATPAALTPQLLSSGVLGLDSEFLVVGDTLYLAQHGTVIFDDNEDDEFLTRLIRKTLFEDDVEDDTQTPECGDSKCTRDCESEDDYIDERVITIPPRGLSDNIIFDALSSALDWRRGNENPLA